MQSTSATDPMSMTYSTSDGITIFKNEFPQSNEQPQYLYNEYNSGNWFLNEQQQVNNDVDIHLQRPHQFEDEFNALKRQFNEPMFIINDTPEVRQLSQYLTENYVIEKHNGQYKCPLCIKLFNGSALARRHVYTHSVDKVFACACQRKFSHARHLRDHIKIKHGNPANIPDRSNRHRSSFDMQNASNSNHFMNHSFGFTGDASINTAFQHEFDTLCELYKDNKSIIVNDLPEIREISQYLMPSYEFSRINDQIMCPLCDGLFNSKSTVRRHLTNHLKVKMFRCGECEREFRHARHLSEHIRQKHQSNFHNGHNTDSEYQQIHCLKSNPLKFKSSNHESEVKMECYRCHMRFRRRNNQKNYSSSKNCCNACHKVLSKRSVDEKNPLNDDTQLQCTIEHDNEPKYKCDVCDVVFVEIEKLHSHRRLHREAVQFYCKFCNFGFTDYKSYVSHEIQHTKSYQNIDQKFKTEFSTPPVPLNIQLQ